MRPIHISTYGFPGVISELVARAAAPLSLTGPDGAEFMRTMLGMVLPVFWANYISLLPEESQREVLAYMQDENGQEAYEAWIKKHADLERDPQAQARADEVLADLHAKLPDLMKEEYSRYQLITKA